MRIEKNHKNLKFLKKRLFKSKIFKLLQKSTKKEVKQTLTIIHRIELGGNTAKMVFLKPIFQNFDFCGAIKISKKSQRGKI